MRGTYGFMAPELLDYQDGPKDGEKVDVWAFGMSLIYIAWQQMPWKFAHSTDQIYDYY